MCSIFFRGGGGGGEKSLCIIQYLIYSEPCAREQKDKKNSIKAVYSRVKSRTLAIINFIVLSIFKIKKITHFFMIWFKVLFKISFNKTAKYVIHHQAIAHALCLCLYFANLVSPLENGAIKRLTFSYSHHEGLGQKIWIEVVKNV